MDRYRDRMWDGEAIFFLMAAVGIASGDQTWLARELPPKLKVGG